MTKKALKRKYRTEKLSAAQAARDQELRRKVEAEFPPLEVETIPGVLRDPLRKAIKKSPKSPAKLAKEARVSPVVLAQFLAGRRDLRLATAEKVAHVLGLELVSKG